MASLPCSSMASGLDLNQPPNDDVKLSDDDNNNNSGDDEMETNGGLGIDLNMHQHHSNTHHHQNGQQGQHQPNNGRPPTHYKRRTGSVLNRGLMSSYSS